MSTSQWGIEPGVMQRLLDEPYRFEFFQAVRLIELWLHQNGVAHDTALTDYLSFRNSVSLRFPASQIEALTPAADVDIRTVAQLTAALLEKRLGGVAITPAFMGYLGLAGVLPNHYTERIAAGEGAEKNEGPRAFLDILSTRALALFYQACAKYRVEYKRDDEGGDGLLPLLLLLAGAAGASPAQDGGLCDETLAHYAAVIRQRAAAGGAIADVLTEYFGVPITLTPFDGCWDDIPEHERCKLGGPNAVLGAGATLGVRRWSRHLRALVRIGPLEKKDYNRFVRGADGALALKKLLGAFPCAPLRFRIQVVLRAQDVRPCRLGPRQPGQLGLGLDTFLVSRPGTIEPDFQYELRLW